MSKAKQLREKIDKHEAYYRKKWNQYKEMDETEAKTLKRFRRLLQHSDLVMDLKLQFSNEMMIEAFGDEEVVEEQQTEVIQEVEGNQKNSNFNIHFENICELKKLLQQATDQLEQFEKTLEKIKQFKAVFKISKS